jgi:hypothetical protein
MNAGMRVMTGGVSLAQRQYDVTVGGKGGGEGRGDVTGGVSLAQRHSDVLSRLEEMPVPPRRYLDK